jgi:hypothetical protein
VVIAIVVVALAILGVGGFLLLSGGDDDDGEDVAADDTTTTTEEQDEETTTTTEPPEDETTTTTAPATTSTSAVEAPGDLTFTEITDDTEQLVVQVPDTWTDVDGRALSEASPNVQASTDLEAFRQLGASGVSFTLLEEENADPDTTMDFLISGQTESCTVEEREDYADPVFTGRRQVLSDCGGQGVTLVVIVATNPAGQSVEVSTVVVPPDPVDEITQQIADTFNVV